MKSPQWMRPDVLLPLLAAVAFAGGMWTGAVLFDRPVRSTGIDKLDTILKIIEGEYVDNVDIDSLIEASIPDILTHLDPHTAYIPAADLQAVNDELGGSFSGIGISFSMMGDTITVLEVISGGPSEKVGIMAGDRIVTINDSTATGRKWTSEKVQRTLRGDKGSKVRLGIKRATAPGLLDFTVVRGDIPVSSVDAAYIAAPGVGYIRVNKFGANTYSEFLQSLMKLKGEGVRDFVVDLRGNTGGYMESAVLMVNEFLERGSMIVSTHGRLPGNDSATRADGSGSFKDARVAVLIDEFSASASEIFAGAIQDNDRGTVVGRRSFGKGLVQNQTMLPDSSALRLTIARYYTPSGRCIQKPYDRDDVSTYSNEILDRYSNGEAFSADSVRIDKSLVFKTTGGRTVYGGGGIMPDVFVPNDTSGVTSWYLQVANAGLLQQFAFHYTDTHRAALSKARNLAALERMLPDDDALLQEFVNFASEHKVPARWYYINISRDLIVNQLKALIARDMLDAGAFYQLLNTSDKAVKRAIRELGR